MTYINNLYYAFGICDISITAISLLYQEFLNDIKHYFISNA